MTIVLLVIFTILFTITATLMGLAIYCAFAARSEWVKSKSNKGDDK